MSPGEGQEEINPDSESLRRIWAGIVTEIQNGPRPPVEMTTGDDEGQNSAADANTSSAAAE